jgi:hypothetical protein
MKVRVTFRSISTSVGIIKNHDIVDLPADEVNKILVTKPHALVVLEEDPAPAAKKPAAKKKAPAKKSPVKRKRARNSDGTLKADDPSTPDINEAWEDGK